MRASVRWCVPALSAGLVLALGLTTTVQAQKQKKVVELTEEQIQEQKGKDIKELVTAYELVEFGTKNKAPEALIVAAGLMRRLATVKMETVADKPMIEVDKDAPAGTAVLDEPAKAPDLGAKSKELFDQAKLMADELEINLDPLIKLAKTRTLTRAPVAGPKLIVRTIGAHQTQKFHFNLVSSMPTHFGFQSSLPQHVVVSGPGGQWGNSTIRFGNATWVPPGRGSVGVNFSVRNPHNRPAQYQMLLN